MNNCIFCKIVKGEVPSYKIFENANFFSFLDISPFVKGHLLVIPKKHVKWVWDLDSKEYQELMDVVYYLAKVLKKTFNTNWVEVVIAGVGVEHAHVHLLPRSRDDGIGEIPVKPLEPKLTAQEMKEIAEKIKKNL